MKAITVVFDYGDDLSYQTLCHVLEKSWAQASDIPLEVIRINPPLLGDRHISFYSNTEKLKVWRENFNQDTIFLDADMLCLRCPKSGFDLVDHIGITDREGRIPINGGVMFLKYTARGREFLDQFAEVNARMLVDKEFHDQYHHKYQGINQSAIGYLIENEFQDYNLLPDTYNCCDPWTNWRTAHLIHIKSSLRKVCLGTLKGRSNSNVRKIKEIWNQFAPDEFLKTQRRPRRPRRRSRSRGRPRAK